jgi:hypothetical protein
MTAPRVTSFPAPATGPAPAIATEPSIVLRILLVLVGGLITVAMLAIGTFTVADSLGRRTEVTQLLLSDVPINHIKIDVQGGSVVLRGGDRRDVRGERRVTHGLQEPSLREVIAGDTLTITGGCPIVSGVWCEVSYNLEVPVAVSIDAENGAGSIDASGLSGSLRLHAGAGSIDLDDASGDLDLKAGAGSIDATRVRSARVVAESGAGSVNVVFVAPPTRVKAQAGAGSVDIEVPRDEATYNVVSLGRGKGDGVDIATNPDSSRSIDADAGAGTVSIHYPER